MAKTEPKTPVPCPQCGKTRLIGRYYANRPSFNGTVCTECRDGSRATHGQSDTRAYHAWENMRARCLNQNFPQYSDYGGRGIEICDRWGKFENFYADMGDPPSRKSLDRIDNDGNYQPGNCRWATQAEQMLNRRANRRISVKGETKTLVEWARGLNTKSYNILKRIKLGWPIEAAVTVPIGQSKTLGPQYPALGVEATRARPKR